jgi:hypothetical protein
VLSKLIKIRTVSKAFLCSLKVTVSYGLSLSRRQFL